jgi:hypothetical protein
MEKQRTRTWTSEVEVSEGPTTACVEMPDKLFLVLEGPRAHALKRRMLHDPRWFGGPDELAEMIIDMAKEERGDGSVPPT